MIKKCFDFFVAAVTLPVCGIMLVSGAISSLFFLPFSLQKDEETLGQIAPMPSVTLGSDFSADIEALRSDFATVGQDMRKAMDIYVERSRSTNH